MEGGLPEGHFMRRNVCLVHGDRKSRAVRSVYDLVAFAAIGLPDGMPRFSADAKELSAKPSVKPMPPRSSRPSASVPRILRDSPARVYLLEPLVTGLVRRISFGRILPEGAGAKDPEDTIEHIAGLARRRSSSTRPSFGRREERLDARPVFVC
jgi:hypothetical protein